MIKITELKPFHMYIMYDGLKTKLGFIHIPLKIFPKKMAFIWYDLFFL